MYTKLNKRASWKSQFEETHCHTASGTHLNAKGLAQATVSTVQGLTPTLASAAAAKMERREQMWRPSQRAKTKGCVKWFSQTKANQEVRDLVWFFCVMFRKLNCTENEIVDCRKNLHWRQVDFCFAFFFNQNTKVSFFSNLFIYFWLHWVLIVASRLSLAVASEIYSLVMVHRFLIAVACLAEEHGLQAHRLQLQHAGSRAQAQ